MLLATITAFDAFVVGTAAVYNRSEINGQLAAEPRQAFQVLCTNISGTSEYNDTATSLLWS